MNELVVADRASEWRRLKALVLDSVSSPITRRVCSHDAFIAWSTLEPRPIGFRRAIVTAWRMALETRGLGPISSLLMSMSESRRSGSRWSKRLTTDCWRRNLLPKSRASKVFRSHGVRVGELAVASPAQTSIPRAFAQRRDRATAPCSPRYSAGDCAGQSWRRSR